MVTWAEKTRHKVCTEWRGIVWVCECVCVWLATPRKKGSVRLGHVLYSSPLSPDPSYISPRFPSLFSLLCYFSTVIYLHSCSSIARPRTTILLLSWRSCCRCEQSACVSRSDAFCKQGRKRGFKFQDGRKGPKSTRRCWSELDEKRPLELNIMNICFSLYV